MPGSSEPVAARLGAFLLAGLLLSLPVRGAEGQIISPGKLSLAHADLEGMGNCTRCHQLRTPGADPVRCLECHEPLARRIRDGKGYHGRIEDPDCGACHKEHLGEDFRLVRFEPSAFQHDSTGYRLEARHLELDCGDCHRAELLSDPAVREFKGEADALDHTFLGLGLECASCHRTDDPHGTQFRDRGCESCHDESGWEQAPGFDHELAGYRLDGRHRAVECAGCHRAEGAVVRYRPVSAGDCGNCHDDPHGGRMEGRCDACHETVGWGSVRRARVEAAFDHDGTRFPLIGAHGSADCASCHDPAGGTSGVRLVFASNQERRRAFPRPDFETCGSCHVDPHRGELAGRECGECHGQDSWTPTTFGLSRHESESGFPLRGAHRAAPCVTCHVTLVEGGGDGFRFLYPDPPECLTCHQADDPHEGAFPGAACDVCHGETTFLMESFDHEEGGHRAWVEDCGSCHQEDQPHGGQFPGRVCSECHATSTFKLQAYDHSGTRFPLDGAHLDLPCGNCHMDEDLGAGVRGIRYTPLDSECVACHGGGK